MNESHSWKVYYETVVKSHVPGDSTQTYSTHSPLLLFCHSIAQFFGNVSVCKGLENIGRRKNIDFFFEWKDEVQWVNFSFFDENAGLMFVGSITLNLSYAMIRHLNESIHWLMYSDEVSVERFAFNSYFYQLDPRLKAYHENPSILASLKELLSKTILSWCFFHSHNLIATRHIARITTNHQLFTNEKWWRQKLFVLAKILPWKIYFLFEFICSYCYPFGNHLVHYVVS